MNVTQHNDIMGALIAKLVKIRRYLKISAVIGDDCDARIIEMTNPCDNIVFDYKVDDKYYSLWKPAEIPPNGNIKVSVDYTFHKHIGPIEWLESTITNILIYGSDLYNSDNTVFDIDLNNILIRCAYWFGKIIIEFVEVKCVTRLQCGIHQEK